MPQVVILQKCETIVESPHAISEDT